MCLGDDSASNSREGEWVHEGVSGPKEMWEQAGVWAYPGPEVQATDRS